MTIPGPVIETIGMRRSGLWIGLLVSGGLSCVFLGILSGRATARPVGCGTLALAGLTVLLLLLAIGSLKEILLPLPLIRVSAEGMAFRIKAGRGFWLAPWTRIRAIRAAEDDQGLGFLEIEVQPDPANPLPSVRLNTGGGPDHTLRFHRGSLAGDVTLMAMRLEAYRRSLAEGG